MRPTVGRHGNAIRDLPVHVAAFQHDFVFDEANRRQQWNLREPNIDVWIVYMNDHFFLDDRARTALIELSTVHRIGYMHANMIIGKCIKKVCNDHAFKVNPFIQGCVKQAWIDVRTTMMNI